MPRRALLFKIFLGVIVAGVASGGLWLIAFGWEKPAFVGFTSAWRWLAALNGVKDQQAAGSEATLSPVPTLPSIKLDNNHPNALHIPEDFLKTRKIRIATVQPAPAPEPLQLSGSLNVDPNRLARIHCLFSGQVLSIGTAEENSENWNPDGQGKKRVLRYGDRVRKDQVLAVIWSKDVGEKKSELVDAISRLDVDRALLNRYLAAEKGVVAERNIQEAKRNVEADLIAVARAERTLRSWRLTEAEIQAVHREAKKILRAKPEMDSEVEKTWAEAVIRAPFDGVLVEKNITLGDLVDPSQDLFKVADLSQLQVLANVYEEDIPAVQALPPEYRHWNIRLKAYPKTDPIPGTFNQISRVIDPTQHTGSIMGLADNPSGKLYIGQFITAAIDLPSDPDLVAVPTDAVIEEGNISSVFIEIDPSYHEFTRRQVAVVRRGRNWIFVRSRPTAFEQRRGDETLQTGERVIVAGALQLAAELAIQKSTTTH